MSLRPETIMRSLSSRNFADLQRKVDRVLTMHDWYDTINLLQSATEQLFHRNWLRATEAIMCLLDMPELFGLDIDIFAQMRTLNQVTALKQASSELYQAFFEMATNQLDSGGSTLFFNARSIARSRSAALLSALVDARFRESVLIVEKIDGFLKVWEKDWFDASGLWRTGNGYRILRATNMGVYINRQEYSAIRELLLNELDIDSKRISNICNELRRQGLGQYLLLSDRLNSIIGIAIDSRGVRGQYESYLQPRIEFEGLDDF